MTVFKKKLPYESDSLFLTDGGLETTLVFLERFDLPYFAAFDLLKEDIGYSAIKNYYRRYLTLAKIHGTNFILESPTWRANPDWIQLLRYPGSALSDINTKAIDLLLEVKKEFENDISSIIISACVGPRGDGYKPEYLMSVENAQAYHASQIGVLGQLPVDMISAITMNYAEEAIGITRSANAANIPAVISFTVETDGKLPTGMSLKDAILLVDESVDQPPVYFMINCAHPTHFYDELLKGKNESWIGRIKGIRANASCKSHAELDASTDLDRGSPFQLGEEHRKLKADFPHLNVFGGCCGTDEEHVLEIVKQLT